MKHEDEELTAVKSSMPGASLDGIDGWSDEERQARQASREHRIRRVAVLGSGVMGSQIAAHCVNAGLEVMLLDLRTDSPGAAPDKIARDAVARLRKMTPAPLALPEWADRIETGSFEDDLHRLAEADWICEAVVERMDVKHELLAKVAKVRRPGSIITTNTSGLPIAEIAAGIGAGEPASLDEAAELGALADFKAHFLGTHFFNPPRYMKLMEIIPTPDTRPEVVMAMTRFCERTLGKGVVIAKDTPNFIANRIGVFSMASMLPHVFDAGIAPEEIDLLTGTLTGYSKAATFRTADMAGLDVLVHVARNILPAIPGDERREVFHLHEGFKAMVDAGRLGNKAGQGFYCKTESPQGRRFDVYDPATGGYREQRDPRQDPRFAAVVEIEGRVRDAGARLAELVRLDDEAGRLIWRIHADLLAYAANRLGEISDSVEAIDRAMIWGFNWELGPFERWDAIGIRYAADRMVGEGIAVPLLIRRMLDDGIERFYLDGQVYDPLAGGYVPPTPVAEGAVRVEDLAREEREVFGNRSVGLYDMGDGIALLEFRTPHKTLGSELVGSLDEVHAIVRNRFDALVIGHDGEHFSYGANLMEAGKALKEGREEMIRSAVESFQRAAVGLRDQPFPVVAAVAGMTFGGGCEFMMHCDAVVAHHELYCGLVEIGVGLVPAGGGTKELLRRHMSRIHVEESADPLSALKAAFKTISMAKTSASAHEARRLGFLRESDTIVMNRDLLLSSAKTAARAMADLGYEPPAKPKLLAMGLTGLSALKMMLHVIGEGRFASPYDLEIASRVALILSGGDLSEPSMVPEEVILRLEREQILQAMADPRTQARMEHMLKTGKPLRN